MSETKTDKATLLPEVVFPRKMSTAWCAVAFEELATAIDFIEAGIEQTTPLQQKLWERYKEQTAQFAHDMLLAEGDLDEITTRLGLNDASR
jgi:hypothetical protein